MAIDNCITKKSNALNLVGMKFGNLTVISRAPNSKANKTRWNCLCLCGSTTISVGSNLKGGHSTTCGCGQAGKVSNLGKKRLDNLIGKVFGRLTVLSRHSNSTDNKPMWLCKCECGNIKSIKAANLRAKNTTSCGCYKNETRGLNFIKHGLSHTPEYQKMKRQVSYQKKRNNPLSLLKLRVRDLIRKSIELRGFRKENSSYKILGCSYDEFRVHIEKQFTKGMSWERFNEIHLDHIIPMASAKSFDDVYKLNHHTNLRPLWAKDNIKKSDSIDYLI